MFGFTVKSYIFISVTAATVLRKPWLRVEQI